MRYVWLLLFSIPCLASESWLCTEDSSQIRGTSVYACGVGYGPDEAIARKKAFDSAKVEFNEVCGPDTPCGGLQFSVRPQRATCGKKDGLWVCYRLVIYSIEVEKRTPKHNSQTVVAHSEDIRAKTDALVDEFYYRAFGGK